MTWKKATTKDGKDYYYNTETKVTQWNIPDEWTQDKQGFQKNRNNEKKDSGVDVWRELKTKDGKLYYYNTLTKVTSWTKPEKQDEPSDDTNTTKDEQSTRIKSNANLREDKPSGASLDEKEEKADAKDRNKNDMDGFENDSTNIDLINIKKPDTLTEAEEIFIQMLNDYKVDSTWSFNKIINDIGTKDPRYWVVDDDPLWKREMFDKYLDNRTQDQLIKESQEINKFTDAFNELLKEKNVKFYNSWHQVKTLIRDEPIFKHSMISNKVKKETFNDYITKLTQEHESKIKITKDQALVELRNYLNNIFLQSNDNWISWNQLLNNYLFKNERFMANKHFKILTHEDILIEYIKIIEEIENEQLKGQLNKIKEQNYTRDRIARDKFKELLAKQDIHVNTTWSQVYDKIKNTTEFYNLLGRNGSNAFQLFYDLKQDKIKILNEKVQLVENILSNEVEGFQWHEQNIRDQRDQIDSILKKNAKRINYPDMDIVLDKLIEQQETKIDEWNKFIIDEDKRKLSHLIDQQLLFPSDIKLEEWSWSQMLNKLQKLDEFKYIQRLDEGTMEKIYNESVEKAKHVSEKVNISKNDKTDISVKPVIKKRTLTESMELDY